MVQIILRVEQKKYSKQVARLYLLTKTTAIRINIFYMLKQLLHHELVKFNILVYQHMRMKFQFRLSRINL